MYENNSTGKILIIDNVASIAEGMKKCLSEKGNLVEVAHSGFEAIDKSRLIKFDIAFVDLTMDKMDGVDTCKKLLSISPSTYLVLTHDHTDDNLRDRIGRLIKYTSKIHFLEKPFTSEMLLHIVEQALKKEDY